MFQIDATMDQQLMMSRFSMSAVNITEQELSGVACDLPCG